MRAGKVCICCGNEQNQNLQTFTYRYSTTSTSTRTRREHHHSKHLLSVSPSPLPTLLTAPPPPLKKEESKHHPKKTGTSSLIPQPNHLSPSLRKQPHQRKTKKRNKSATASTKEDEPWRGQPARPLKAQHTAHTGALAHSLSYSSHSSDGGIHGPRSGAAHGRTTHRHTDTAQVPNTAVRRVDWYAAGSCLGASFPVASASVVRPWGGCGMVCPGVFRERAWVPGSRSVSQSINQSINPPICSWCQIPEFIRFCMDHVYQ